MDELNKNPMAGDQQAPVTPNTEVNQPTSIPVEEPKKEEVAPAQEAPASDIPGTTPENTPTV